MAADTRVAALSGLTSAAPRAISLQRVSVTNGVDHVVRAHPDATIVDGRLTSAIRIVQSLRTEAPTVPILFVADQWSAVTRAICAGATDFVMAAAPCAETVLRLQCLATAAGRPLATTRVIGRLHLDRDARSLAAGHRSILLTPIELKMFERLLLEPGQPVSRADLERSVWRQEEVDDHPTNIAVVYVSYLRRKLAKLGGSCTIRTITNEGYALELAPVRRRGSAARRRTR